MARNCSPFVKEISLRRWWCRADGDAGTGRKNTGGLAIGTGCYVGSVIHFLLQSAAFALKKRQSATYAPHVRRQATKQTRLLPHPESARPQKMNRLWNRLGLPRSSHPRGIGWTRTSSQKTEKIHRVQPRCAEYRDIVERHLPPTMLRRLGTQQSRGLCSGNLLPPGGQAFPAFPPLHKWQENRCAPD